MDSKQTKFVVVTGGVISGVGKGVVTASIGKILKEYGFNITLIKIDPYINCDAGTLRPTEHGEVWVTEDGGEIDQDLGTYERFINVSLSKKNSITTGQVYHSVIQKERNGEYLGQTVQYIPHITGEIVHRVKQAAEGFDVVVIEVGGTAGDYENEPFLFALKSIEREYGPQSVAHVLVTYLPVPSHIGEMKTKPTQQAIRMLGEQGIVPDFIICRSKDIIDEVRKSKIEACAHVRADHILSAPDIESIYEVPMLLEKEQLGKKLLHKLGLVGKQEPDWSSWKTYIANTKRPEHVVTIGIIGKYMAIGNYDLTDTYLSVSHALLHAGAHQKIGIQIKWIDAKKLELGTSDTVFDELDACDGLIVPGGFGTEGVEGKIAAISWARKRNIPYLGICYGLQLAVVEYARNLCGLIDAHTTEVNSATKDPVVTLLEYQTDVLKEKKYGGTMRLGAYPAQLQPNTKVNELYQVFGNLFGNITAPDGSKMVLERHRHRYEVNPTYISLLQKHGMTISGMYTRKDGTQLVEYIELANHPFFVATQAHPEFTSRFESPNPLFIGLVAAARERQLVKINSIVSVVDAPGVAQRRL